MMATGIRRVVGPHWPRFRARLEGLRQRQYAHEEMCRNGHLLDCLALEPAWDLGDLWDKTCPGCCPHGYKPAGFVAWQTQAAHRFVRFMSHSG